MSSTSTDTETRAPAKPVEQVGDRVFANLALGAGVLILVVLAGVAVFLIARGGSGDRRARVGAARRATASSPTSPRWSSAPSSRR